MKRKMNTRGKMFIARVMVVIATILLLTIVSIRFDQVNGGDENVYHTTQSN